jgi:4-amino-4-deoxy-L-arabinose transferase-like glycosyltransferase
VFVWAPHPWGWGGIDGYHELGLGLARGGSFPTTDVPWGYAYYLAPFYAIFGDRPWIPVAAQAVLNAVMPLLVYRFARDAFDERIAIVAAVITGLGSFNTVYASTQSSDAVCNVLFMTAVLAFTRAAIHGDPRLYAVSGALLGLAAQFRPNLILVPGLLALWLVIERRSWRRAAPGAVVVAAAVAMLLPWMIRNYALARELIPTSTHGGVQLWYGTLQSGAYVESAAYNPRRTFETASFPYTSLDRVPLVLTWHLTTCDDGKPPALSVEYWTDRDPVHRKVNAVASAAGDLSAELPPAPDPTAYYFHLAGSRVVPNVFFISTDHLGDMDRHGDLLDVFDVARLMRHAAWNERIANPARFDFDRDGQVTAADVTRAAGILLVDSARAVTRPNPVGALEHDDRRVTLRLDAASAIAVPRQWSGRVTDLEVTGPQAVHILQAFLPFAALDAGKSAAAECDGVERLAVNDVFYRDQPHRMRRYLALAIDNIRREPAAYAAGVVYRAVRVFFIQGSDDPNTVQQFSGSGRVYAVAQAASMGLFAVAVAGIVIGWRRGYAIGLPLLLVAYIPATLAFVLTNMRYSVTVQPFLFMFAATALVALWDARASRAGRGSHSPSARR